MSSQQIFDLVQNALDQKQPRSYRLDALREGIQHNGNWWYVVVRPSKPVNSASGYARKMASIENSIEQIHGLKVLLVPSVVN